MGVATYSILEVFDKNIPEKCKIGQKSSFFRGVILIFSQFPHIQSKARLQVVVSEDDYFVARSDTLTKITKKKTHNFAGSVLANETLPKCHTKQ